MHYNFFFSIRQRRILVMYNLQLRMHNEMLGISCQKFLFGRHEFAEPAFHRFAFSENALRHVSNRARDFFVRRISVLAFRTVLRALLETAHAKVCMLLQSALALVAYAPTPQFLAQFFFVEQLFIYKNFQFHKHSQFLTTETSPLICLYFSNMRDQFSVIKILS